ncbi:trafficking protein particle complex subunit 8-like [Panonychus citri]|uniref:trafficking protein particle complex subunit 8-like n=1 Tax=Panonychus citri TaxID=50023 RepID=UPI00230763A6|nr:trafficking protein particle complex subunit 8-like [Panonychus citri]
MENINQYIESMFSINMTMMFSSKAKALTPNIGDLLKQFKNIKGLQASIREPNSDKYYAVNDLKIKLSESRDTECKPNPIQVKKLLHDCVLSYNNELNTLNGGSNYNGSPNETPWFNAWKKVFLSNLESNDHEFIGAHVGVIFFLAEGDLDNFREVLNKLQTEVKSISSIKWFFPNFLKYIVVLSDKDSSLFNQESDEFGPTATLHPAYSDLVAMYDTNKCFWFEIDPIVEPESSEVTISQDTTDNVNMVKSIEQQDPLTSLLNKKDTEEYGDEPIVTPLKQQQDEYQQVKIISQKMLNKCDKLLRRMFVRAVIPWFEKQLGILAEALASRKGLRRSIFSATKQLLAISSSTMNLKGTNQSVVYSLEANEMQYRKFADLTMCLGLYDVAYNSYYAARKEFQSEGAWLYYAGASEAAAIASYLLNKFQKYYLDQAIVYYLESSKSSHLATRVTLFATDVIRETSPSEAASFFIRLTAEDSDLRSGLFLEQAANCYLVTFPSRKRKAIFHYVLAGHRYNRCGLKRLALSSYLKYSLSHWSYAIEHVKFTMAKLYIQISSTIVDKETKTLYRDRGLNLLQTNADKQLFFNEFLKELKSKEDEDDSTITHVNVPKIEDIVICTIEGSISKGGRTICFLAEPLSLQLTLSSSFDIQLDHLKLLVDQDEVNCSPVNVNLEAGQPFKVTCSLVPTVICDFNLIGISFNILGVQFVNHFNERLTKCLHFSSIETLPPLDVTIKLGKTIANNNSTIELFTGQIIDLTIECDFTDLNISKSTYQAKLTTNGNLKGFDCDLTKQSTPITMGEINSFQFQAPYIAKQFPLYFKIIYSRIGDNRERTVTRNISLRVRECLQLDGLFHSVVSLKNLSTVSSLILFSGDNEKLEVGPGLTGHILAHDNYIHWEGLEIRGDINISI